MPKKNQREEKKKKREVRGRRRREEERQAYTYTLKYIFKYILAYTYKREKERKYMNKALLLALLSTLWTGSRGLDIHTNEELREFSRRVSLGNTFEGVTILLQDDIDLENEDFTPIGSPDNEFKGKFDGQGHKISNLNITSSTEESSAGLFGAAAKCSIKNIVLDSSCRIELAKEFLDDNNLHIGGIVGYIFVYDYSISIENSISMINIYAELLEISNVIIGGILGYAISYGERTQITNCWNIGDIIINGTSEKNGMSIGGILGYGVGVLNSIKISNCMNTGNIIMDTYTGNYTIGGIAGEMHNVYLSNCINLGALDYDISSPYIGELVGNCFSSSVSYCYRRDTLLKGIGESNNSSDINYYSFNNDFVLDERVSVGWYSGKSLISALNGYADSRDTNKWLLNKNAKIANFLIDSTKMKLNVSFETQIILRPKMADEGNHHFYGWYRDAALSESFEGEEITTDITLYGKYAICDEVYTITFNTYDKEVIDPLSVKFGEVVELPRGHLKEDEMIGVWKNDFGENVGWSYTMPAKNVTFYARWMNVNIKTPKELKTFSDDVKSGVDCFGLTIYLENDIDMKGVDMTPIGTIGSSFDGTFDGKGHVIQNMNIRTSHAYSGLFGFSETGMTVRNVIFDKSCNFIALEFPDQYDDFSIDRLFLGGAVGYCSSKHRDCNVKNIVNMGNIKIEGESVSYYKFTGGLVGYLETTLHNSVIRNTAFLGNMNVPLTSNDGVIGGIVGSMKGIPGLERCRVENSIFGGEIKFADGDNNYFIGGIGGIFSEGSIAQNCVNTGSITIEGQNGDNVVKGIIVGRILDSAMKNCYWYDDGIPDIEYGSKENSAIKDTSYFGKDFNLAEKVSVADGVYSGYTLVEALNAFTFSGIEFSRWVTNYNGNTEVSFMVNGTELYTTNSMVILLPSFASDGTSEFFGWCTDRDASTLFTENEIDEMSTLCGEWRIAQAQYTVTFVSTDFAFKRTKVSPGDIVNASNVIPTRDGYELIGWTDEYRRKVDDTYLMPYRNLTLSALWLKTEISSPMDLKEFSEAVNRGADCNGRTVQLMKDIDMGMIDGFEPIGTTENPFRGVFEGHGHRISNLRINTTAKYSGFFGNAFGATMRNFFLDESNRIESNFSMGYGCLGGVVGYCAAEKQDCTIINVANQGEVIFSGSDAEMKVNVGGIIGLCKAFEGECFIDNCANYGNVAVPGEAGSAWIGGIAGKCSGNTLDLGCKIWNNLNYGTIDCAECSFGDDQYIGGIVGYCNKYNEMNGCVSAGKILVDAAYSSTSGSISGYKDGTSEVRENIWSWEIEYGDYGDDNLAIMKNVTLENRTSVLDFLKNTAEVKTIPEQENVKEYATTWVVNPQNALITAKVGGKVVAAYNSTIVLLPTFMDSEKFYFEGWKRDGKITSTTYVDEDTVFEGEWLEYPDIIDIIKDNLIYMILAPSIVIIIIIVILYAKGYRNLVKKNRKILDLMYPEIPEADEPEFSLNKIEDLYPVDYRRPTMVEALKNAGLDENQAVIVSSACYKVAYEVEKKGELPDGLTVDDAAAITMYTFDFGVNGYNFNPYRLINSALFDNNVEGVRKAKDILYLVMSALRKLPVITGKPLFRGIRVNVGENGGGFNGQANTPTYEMGSIITWSGLSSTSPEMEVTKEFLARGSMTRKAAGTIFIIADGWGYDIQPYSLFPTETEILLEPGRQFKITSVIPAAELTIVNLKMLRTTIPFPDLYGRHKFKVSPLYFVDDIKESFENFKNKREERRRRRMERENRETKTSDNAQNGQNNGMGCTESLLNQENDEKRGFDDDDMGFGNEKRGFDDGDMGFGNEKRGFDDGDMGFGNEKRGFDDGDLENNTDSVRGFESYDLQPMPIAADHNQSLTAKLLNN